MVTVSRWVPPFADRHLLRESEPPSGMAMVVGTRDLHPGDRTALEAALSGTQIRHRGRHRGFRRATLFLERGR